MSTFKHFLPILLLTTLAQSIEVDKETECLALNIYYEARSSNLADQAAVADVVLNRVESKDYPNTICEVVKQGRISKWHLQTKGKIVPLKHQCQFSWYCDGKPDIPRNQDAWEKAKLLAFKMNHYQHYRGISEFATHYHATYVNPFWAKDFHLIGQIGSHIYYRKDRKDSTDDKFTTSN